ncbi:hypothetical protein E2C01_078248 [Portunus trituberculatus]|uniref:Uncharacterized protein n=1 Tax=Portunus trituberculatus TaxID=210409 RepID=A0A5B7IPL2_PORTR|nr:hypothetical protein [Portunus trituberculatus]
MGVVESRVNLVDAGGVPGPAWCAVHRSLAAATTQRLMVGYATWWFPEGIGSEYDGCSPRRSTRQESNMCTFIF